MSKLSLKNTNELTVLESFNDFKDKCQIKNLSKKTIKLYVQTTISDLILA